MARGYASDLPPRAPHPGAQLSFTDPGGHRFHCFITDQTGDDTAGSRSATVHTRASRTASAAPATPAFATFPFRDFEANEVWLELLLMAQDLLAFTATLCLEGELRRAEPKRLRQRFLHVAGKRICSARGTTLHLPRLAVGAGAPAGVRAPARIARAT